MNTRYQVIGPIAEGGRGEVLKAWDSNLGREVAIKRVKKDGTGEVDGAIEDLVKEARTLSTLQHPNVVSVFDVGMDDEGAYIVMELVKGETLEDIIAKGAMTESDFDSLVNQTMEGLIAAHAAGLIHMDLKPQNLMIMWHASGSFQVKILDFGLALAAVTPVEQELDEDGGILGSIFFMAPEQFERSPVDVRTDLYSLGCILYYALTTRYPFRGETGPEVMTAHLYHQLTSLAKLRPDLPAFIPQWVDWLIRRVPDERPASTAVALSAYRTRQLPGVASVPVSVVASDPAAVASTGVRIVDGKVQRDLQPQGLLGESKKVAAQGSGVSVVRPAASRRPPPATSKAGDAVTALSRYTLPVLAVLVLISGVFYFLRKNAENKKMARFAELANDDSLVASGADANLLIGFLDDPAATAAAAQTLANLKGNEAINTAVLAALKTAKGRYETVNLLNVCSLRGLVDAVPVAMSRLGSEDLEIRKACWNALASLADADKVEELLQKAEGLDEELAKYAEVAVVAMVDRAKDRERASAPILNVYRSGLGDDSYRSMVVRMLGKVGGKEALVQMEKAIQNPSIEVRKAAISAIAQWPSSDPLELMVAHLNREDDPAGRLLTIMAVGQLLAKPGVQSHEKRFEIGKSVYEMAKDRREQDQAIAGLSRVESAQTLAFFDGLAEVDPKRASQAKGIRKNQEGKLAGVVRVDGGEAVLRAAAADFNRGSMLNVVRDSLVNWQDNADWASWLVEVPKAGVFQVVVNQAAETEKPGVYEVVLAGKALVSRSVETGGEFKDFEVGEIEVKEPGTHRLLIRAKQVPMNESLFSLREVRLMGR